MAQVCASQEGERCDSRALQGSDVEDDDGGEQASFGRFRPGLLSLAALSRRRTSQRLSCES